MRKILLAEDDADFANILKQYLEISGFSVSWCKDGEEALRTFGKDYFDICVFDVMMPNLDGFTLAEKIIEINPEIPFVFLTARSMKEDKLKGLRLGADDYIVKPFEADELILRLSNILRRNDRKRTAENFTSIKIGTYVLDSNRFELKWQHRNQQLTERETALILYLYNNRNQILKRDEILKNVWGNDDYFSGRSMDVFISRLRKYFSEDSTITIASLRNIGLEFRVPA